MSALESVPRSVRETTLESTQYCVFVGNMCLMMFEDSA